MFRPLVRVLVGDAQPLFRDALDRAMRQCASLQLVAEVADAPQALEAVRALRPDVAILGATPGGLDARRVIRAIARDELVTRALVLLGDAGDELIFDMVACGAAGCLTRAVDPGVLVSAVESAARGETVVAPDLQAGLAREVQLRSGLRGPLLTTRERDVLRLVAEGASTGQIASRLHVAPTTVKTHLGHAYEKLGASDRASAVAAGMRRGLLD